MRNAANARPNGGSIGLKPCLKHTNFDILESWTMCSNSRIYTIVYNCVHTLTWALGLALGLTFNV